MTIILKLTRLFLNDRKWLEPNIVVMAKSLAWHVFMKVSEQLPTSLDHLQEIFKEIWTDEISVDYCRKLLHSMPHRINAILKNKQLPTKY
jgi:hypothetical protein